MAGLTDQSEHHCVAFTASGGLDLFLDTVSSPRLVDQSSTSEIPMSILIPIYKFSYTCKTYASGHYSRPVSLAVTLCNLVSHETCSAHCFNNTLIFHFVLKTVGLTDRTAAWTPEDVLDQFPGENNFTVFIKHEGLVDMPNINSRHGTDGIYCHDVSRHLSGSGR